MACPVSAPEGSSTTAAAATAHPIVAIMGPSGSGKSTLLNVLGTLDRPSTGRVFIDGVDVAASRDAERSGLRAHRIGFIFQQFHLSEGMSADDNAAMELLYSGAPRWQRRLQATQALERVGLGHRLGYKPNQLSGGEWQRVAIARAVVHGPSLLLADEPTGNLDTKASASIVSLFHELHASGTCIVVITHDTELASRLPRQVTIRDGRLIGDTHMNGASL